MRSRHSQPARVARAAQRVELGRGDRECVREPDCSRCCSCRRDQGANRLGEKGGREVRFDPVNRRRTRVAQLESRNWHRSGRPAMYCTSQRCAVGSGNGSPVARLSREELASQLPLEYSASRGNLYAKRLSCYDNLFRHCSRHTCIASSSLFNSPRSPRLSVGSYRTLVLFRAPAPCTSGLDST